MSFNPNIPLPGDLLSNSQLDLKNNFTASNTSFGVDHYAFSDLTANNGKHNTVTTPLIVGSAHPVTAAAEPKFYAMQDSVNLGVLQYSRGPSNASPSPITSLQSSTTPIVLAVNATTNILDATGLTFIYGTILAFDLVVSGTTSMFPAFWDGTAWRGTSNLTTNTRLSITNSGNILQLKNTSSSNLMSNVYWTFNISRINI